MNRFWIVMAVVAAVAAGGCTTRGKKGGIERPSNSSGYNGSGSADGSAGAAGAAGLPGTDSDEDLPKRTVYFDLDKSEIKSESIPVVDAWAKYLAANPSAKVRLEGHCDERGTREYNVALGERRSNAVLEALTSRGVGAAQLTPVSFGEERPIALGHDEAAWSQNRRVELLQQ